MSLLKRLTRRQPPPGPAERSTIAPDANALQWFQDKLMDVPEPAVLDLGTGVERQVMSLLAMGYRVTADDTVATRLARVATPAEDDVFSIAQDPARYFRLDIADGSHQGVLAWSTFDRLSYLGGFLLASELGRILQLGGVVTGTWAGPPAAQRRSRVQFRGAPLVAGRRVHPMRFLDPTPCRYEVREVLDIFMGFTLVHSMVYVDGTRRMLLEKTSGPNVQET